MKNKTLIGIIAILACLTVIWISKSSSDNMEDSYEKALHYVEEGNYTAAIDIMELALKENTENRNQIYYNMKLALAMTYAQVGRRDEGDVLLKEIMKDTEKAK